MFGEITHLSKELVILVGGLICLFMGWALLRVGVAEQSTALRALFVGILGLFLLFCAYRLISQFLDLASAQQVVHTLKSRDSWHQPETWTTSDP